MVITELDILQVLGTNKHVPFNSASMALCYKLFYKAKKDFLRKKIANCFTYTA